MQRFRPTRADQTTRDRNAETQLAPADFIQPYFVVPGEGVKRPIRGLTEVFHFSVDQLLEKVKSLRVTGVNKILLFGVIPDNLKNAQGTHAYAPDNLVAQAIGAVRRAFPEILVISDVCLCGYTDHGHCGLVSGSEVLNDESLPLLGQMAVSHARAGADFVAPSAMLDGQVAAIRQSLDAAGFNHTRILAYSAKYASVFYGPFRQAAGSAPAFGDRQTYQMDFRNANQALGEVAADVEEGADWVMVKPAMPYLDVVARVKQGFPEHCLAAYQVSGEYMLIKAGGAAGVVDETRAMLESLYAIRRAGADYIITYFAHQAAELLQSRRGVRAYGTGATATA
jgi:porphobilinogen synthase